MYITVHFFDKFSTYPGFIGFVGRTMKWAGQWIKICYLEIIGDRKLGMPIKFLN
jgi:hypothetical protein